jgi:hypothetical protein
MEILEIVRLKFGDRKAFKFRICIQIYLTSGLYLHSYACVFQVGAASDFYQITFR